MMRLDDILLSTFFRPSVAKLPSEATVAIMAGGWVTFYLL
jgi:hypothetical protein